MDDNDVSIELGQSVRRHIENKQSPAKDRGLAAAPYDQPDADKIPVFVSLSAARAIEKHIAAHKDREVGGVLLGDFYRSEDGSFVEITDIIEARSAEGTDVSLTFTHETWEQMNAEQSRKNPALQIVGWYHSHPGLGVFMSREDQFIHSSYFADPWHVALVVDPIYHNWGCFKWNDGELERSGGFYVYAPKREASRVKEYSKNLNKNRHAPAVDASASADRRAAPLRKTGPLWLAIVVLLILEAATAYIALTRSPGKVIEQDRYKTAIALLSASDLTDGASYLRAEIIAHPDNSAAYRELQRVNRLNAPGMRDERLDQTNLMLAMADKLARTRAKLGKEPGLGDLIPKSRPAGEPIKLEAANPVANALQVYREASATRDARLRRAVRIAQICVAPAGPGHGDGTRSTWCNKAVDWLRGERLREIAYGLQSSAESYQQAYDRLSGSEKAEIKRIRAELMKPR